MGELQPAQFTTGLPISAFVMDAKTLLRSLPKLGTFDLVYSLGLFDYLPRRAAMRTLAAMTKLLSPGGTAVVANFSPCLPDAGYMEAFMDWWLIYRGANDLQQLCVDLNFPSVETYSDPSGCLALLNWTRQ